MIKLESETVTPMFDREIAIPDTFSHHSNLMTENKFTSSNYEENQRGGVDEVKNFNYSFNPKVDLEIATAVVPYRGRSVSHKLLHLIPNSTESELSRELIEKSTFKVFKKIQSEGEYDFDNPKSIDLDKLKGVSRLCESVFINEHNGNPMQTHTSMSSLIQGYGHNVETFLLLKQLKKKRELENLSSVKDSKLV